MQQGKTEKCLPPKNTCTALTNLGFDLNFSINHWSNEELSIDWIDRVLRPYFAKTKTALGLPADHPCLLLVDCWQIHLSKAFRVSIAIARVDMYR